MFSNTPGDFWISLLPPKRVPCMLYVYMFFQWQRKNQVFNISATKTLKFLLINYIWQTLIAIAIFKAFIDLMVV